MQKKSKREQESKKRERRRERESKKKKRQRQRRTRRGGETEQESKGIKNDATSYEKKSRGAINDIESEGYAEGDQEVSDASRS